MFDCMEALGLAPRPLFDVSGQGSCMLGKATPYFSSLEPFAWAGTSSVQCEYSTLSIRLQLCMCPYQSPSSVILELSPQEESDSFQFYIPFSPCSLFVYVLSVLCGCERVSLGSAYLYITLFVFFMNDFT